MCLPFIKKADVEAGRITVRKRYSPRHKECVLEVVKRRPVVKEISFWLCACGLRLHTDILVCSGCGRHRHHHQSLPVEPVPEPGNCEKAYEVLKKELDGLCKDVKDLKGEKDKKPDKEPEPTKPPPPPNPTPNIPQLPFIPLVPAPWLECPKPPEEPKPEPEPSPQPEHPLPQPPVVVVNVPECSERSKERPRRRRRDYSPSTCSDVSVGSFQRVRRRVNVLGRRLWNLEDREALREEAERHEVMAELRFRRQADERRRLIEAEDRARHRALDFERDELVSRERREREREMDAESELDRERRDLDRREERERGRDRAFWRRREWDWDARAFPTWPERHVRWRSKGPGPYLERWERGRIIDE